MEMPDEKFEKYMGRSRNDKNFIKSSVLTQAQEGDITGRKGRLSQVISIDYQEEEEEEESKTDIELAK